MHHRTLRKWREEYGKYSIEEWESPDGKHWHMISQEFKEDD